jgi:hypothetical protein
MVSFEEVEPRLQISSKLTDEQKDIIKAGLPGLLGKGWVLLDGGRGIEKTFRLGGWVKPLVCNDHLLRLPPL